MTPSGYSLVRTADGAIVASWQAIPGRIAVPGTEAGVFAATPAWKSRTHHIAERVVDQAVVPHGKHLVSGSAAVVESKVVVPRTSEDLPVPVELTGAEKADAPQCSYGLTLDEFKTVIGQCR